MSDADTSARPSVFISYSHDSPAHISNVLQLAKRLRLEGIPCEVDQFHESPPEGWPRWMLNQIEEASYVLVVCTETYDLRFRGKEKAGTGKGAKWEGGVITQELYDSELYNTSFIPVLLDRGDEKHIPIVLKSATYYDLSTEDGFTNLFRRLTQQPKSIVPPVAAKVTRLPTETDEGAVRKFADDVANDVTYYTAKLGSWPAASFGGEEVIAPLSATLEKVQANPDYRQSHPNVAATIYRMLGGACLIHTKLEMPDKIRQALPYLKRSLEIWPEQELLQQNVAFLQTFLHNQGGNSRDYLTAVFQILRGPRDPDIPVLVEKMSSAMSGPERQAQSWLLNQATPSPVWGFLQAVQIMLKKERNIEAAIDVTTRMLPDNKVEVQAKVGPNVFLWDVDYAQKKYESKNELTEGFMGLIRGSKT